MSTNEELLAYLETVVQFFSKDNLLELYRANYEDLNEFLSYLKNTIKTIGFRKDKYKNITFIGTSDELNNLAEKIHKVTGENKPGVINRIVDPKWWQQLAKNLNRRIIQPTKTSRNLRFPIKMNF